MSMSVFQTGLLTAGLLFLVGGAVLAVIASRLAAAARTARADADIRLAASQELAVEVKRLAEKVEQSLAARDGAIENAFLRHNDACMASVQSTLATHASGGHGHDDDDDDDDHHKKHHAVTRGSGHDDDDDDDDHHKKHHAVTGGSGGENRQHAAAGIEKDRPSFFARVFRRYP
jgi:hypothetical protein